VPLGFFVGENPSGIIAGMNQILYRAREITPALPEISVPCQALSRH